ncbi:MAG: antitoxin [Campylobacterota bacterium]|nr:antitoxin [Campylobacterota bacterium]
MYSKEEVEIIDYIENENPNSVPDKEDKIAKIKSMVSAKYQQRKAINIKVLESDLELLKAKALKEGMPYQTLINSVLHKFVTNQLSENKMAI